jgi:hypothetical protein
MQLIIDGAIYKVDLKKVSTHLQEWWNSNRTQLDDIKLENGKSLDFSQKSLARIGFKTLMTPILIPMIHMLYAFKHAEPPKKERHQDLLDYATLAMLGFIGELDGDKLYVESLEDTNSNSRCIKSIATYGQERYGQLGQPGEHNKDTEVSTGGQACIPGGPFRNGEDVSAEIDSEEKARSPTVAEHILAGHEEKGGLLIEGWDYVQDRDATPYLYERRE